MTYKILLNPGPTNTSGATKEAQTLGSDVCHRTDDFYAILKETKTLLLQRFFLGSASSKEEDWHIALLGGSGTMAMEAMVSSLCANTGTHVLIAGKYGARLEEMMQTYRIDSQKIISKNSTDIQHDQSIKSLFFVENETTTGEKFTIESVHQKFPNARLFVDATAAFGASHYTNSLEHISAISFCSNKCLQSTPGLGMVIWRKELPIHPRSYYGNLSRYIPLIPPFTIPVQSVHALRNALQESKDNTAIFDRRSKELIADLKKIGILCINEHPCNSIIGFSHPAKTYEELRLFLQERNIVIYSGIAGYKNSFRLATMSVDFDKQYDFILKTFHESIY